MRTAFFIPTYNEAENLPTLVERLLALEVAPDVVVVDDNSPDGTGRIADELAAAIARSRPRDPSHRSSRLRGCQPGRPAVVSERGLRGDRVDGLGSLPRSGGGASS